MTSSSGSAGYIALPVTTDPDQLAADAIAYLSAQQPGWVAREGHLEVWMLRAFARMAAESAKVAAQVPLAIFQQYGQQLIGLPPRLGSAAHIATTWTMVDTAGYFVPAGTTVAYRVSPASSALFQTTADFLVPAGAIKTVAGAVSMTAVAVGTSGNDLPAAPLVMVDNLSFVASVESTTTSVGGGDAETTQQYLDRLATQLQLLVPRPILPGDFAALARTQPGVARCVVLDGFNRSDGSYDNPRMVTVVVVDEDGQPLSGAAQTQLETALNAQREINFAVDVMDPTYTPVHVSAQLVPRAGANPDTVSVAAQAALRTYLSPANWGGPPPAWTNQTTVRYLQVAQLLGEVPGVDYVSDLQLAPFGGLLHPAEDVVLTGHAPLPQPGNLNVIVTGTTPTEVPITAVFAANADIPGEGTINASGTTIDTSVSVFGAAQLRGAGSVGATASVTGSGTGGGGDDGTQAAVLFNWGPIVFGDEFNYTGKPDSAKWNMYDGPGHDNNGIRTPNAWSVANGYLTCFGDAAGNTGGMEWRPAGRRYGRYEVRARMYAVAPFNGGKQYHPVLIQWPDDDSRTNSGEEDYMETDIGADGVDAYLHHPGNGGNDQDHYFKKVDITVWHNYAFEWGPGRLRGWIDGVLWFDDTDSAAQPPRAMHQTIQMDNFGGSPHQPAKFDIDWFRAYAAPS